MTRSIEEELDENLIVPQVTQEEINPFWDGVELPHQTEDTEFPLVNSVVAAEWFAKKTSDIAYLNGQAEILTEEIENLKVHKRRKETSFARFRRKLLADHYDKITKSADKEIQAAFLLKIARETELGLLRLETFEEELEEITRQIEVREPRRDQFHTRLKALRDSQDAARQYLDFNKLEMRLGQQGGRV
jgi:hypothetical protein